MKTYREILEEIFNKGGISLSEVYESAAKEYARQCCEDLRSRCYCNNLPIWYKEDLIEIILP